MLHRLNGLSLVRIYLGQASGQVLQYKCTLSLYFTITVRSKVCALLIAGCRSILADLSRACYFLAFSKKYWISVSKSIMQGEWEICSIMQDHAVMQNHAGSYCDARSCRDAESWSIMQDIHSAGSQAVFRSSSSRS